jgi:hypothetical protein
VLGVKLRVQRQLLAFGQVWWGNLSSTQRCVVGVCVRVHAARLVTAYALSHLHNPDDLPASACLPPLTSPLLQVGRSFSWTEKLLKRPDPVPDRFLPDSKIRPSMVPRGAGEARAQSLAAAARESSSIVRAMKSEAAAAARARTAAAAATCKQPSSATQQRRARKAATS